MLEVALISAHAAHLATQSELLFALDAVTGAGSVRSGVRADLVVLDAPSHVHLAYRPGVPLVAAVVRRGEVAFEAPRPGPTY
jgi:imidazolonepropionase-like amidohydrolase